MEKQECVRPAERKWASQDRKVLEMPNLIGPESYYQWFLGKGLKEVFDDISPIADFAGHLSLGCRLHALQNDIVPRSKCKERDATYAAPLKSAGETQQR